MRNIHHTPCHNKIHINWMVEFTLKYIELYKCQPKGDTVYGNKHKKSLIDTVISI